jgi:putative DNA primase/helicase
MNFLEFARANGLLVDRIPADGNWHRVPTASHKNKRNGSVKLFPDGRVGFVEDHASGAGLQKWTAGDDVKLAPIDFAAIERRKAEARRKLIAATQAMRAYYLGCKALKGGHDYLTAHGLGMEGCFGLRSDFGWLVIPVIKAGNLISVQRISQGGEKKFWPGCPVKGGSYVVNRQGAQLSVLCEGLATGLAIFAACRQARVIVGFDAHNMIEVAEAFPKRGLTVIAADNDSATAAKIGHNPGLEAAQEAAAALGCGIAYPEGISGTDWCDARLQWLAESDGKQPGEARRAVDSKISAAILKAAKFLHPVFV